MPTNIDKSGVIININQLHIIVLIFSMFKIISYYVRPPSTMNAILVTNKLIVNSKPSLRNLVQPRRMAAHASDQGDPLIPRCIRGKSYTMVMMFVGEVVSVVDEILVVFLLHKS